VDEDVEPREDGGAVFSDFEEGVDGWGGVVESAATVVGEDYAGYLRYVEGDEVGVFVCMGGIST